MADQPNILFLLSDQHNPHIAGYAGDRYARTGGLDALAAESMCFDAAYCQSPLCVPSRISMLTGKLPAHCSAWNNSSRLDDEHTTFARHLSEHGYTTAHVGKMHLAGRNWMGGFDHRPYGDLRTGRFNFHQPDPVKTWDGRWNNHHVGRFPWAGETEIPESLLVDEVATRETLAFLREHADANPDTPWCMVTGYSRPHFPLTAPGRYIRRAMANMPPLPDLPPGYPQSCHPHDRFTVADFCLTEFSLEEQRRALACYYACVDYMDDCIRDLLDALRRDGLLENTYIVYSSDHGDMAGEHGLWWKRSYYEGSARVPLLVSGPGIVAGQSKLPVELLDLYPTFCEMAGIPIPAGLDGESLLGLCQGNDSNRTKRMARCDFLNGKPQTAFQMARNERWKMVQFPAAPPVLFHMENDPDETRNLLAAGAERRAEAGAAEVAAQLSRAMSWEQITARQVDDKARWASWEKIQAGAPAQYQLADGRVIDADQALYPSYGTKP